MLDLQETGARGSASRSHLHHLVPAPPPHPVSSHSHKNSIHPLHAPPRQPCPLPGHLLRSRMFCFERNEGAHLHLTEDRSAVVGDGDVSIRADQDLVEPAGAEGGLDDAGDSSCGEDVGFDRFESVASRLAPLVLDDDEGLRSGQSTGTARLGPGGAERTRPF